MEKKKLWGKKSIWPYKETYKDYTLDVFKDGSIIACGIAFGNLTQAFEYIDTVSKANLDKKENMTFTTITTACTGTPFHTNDFYAECISLAPCPPQACNKVSGQKGNNPMYVDNDKHIESSKINYLTDRVSAVFYNKERPLMKQFNLIDDESPATVQEFVDRITSGKFTFKDATKKDTKGYYYRPLEGIRWRDPAAKEDQAGFDAAWTAFQKVYQDAKDTIAIGTPAEGLAAVKALDAWTPAVTASSTTAA